MILELATSWNRVGVTVAAVLMLAAQIAAPCAAQVLEQVSIAPVAQEYQPIVLANDVAVRIKSPGSFVAVDLNNNKELWIGGGLGGTILSGSENGSGTRFAALSSDGVVRLWDFTSGRLLRAEPPGQDRARSVKLSEDGERLVLLLSSGQLVVSDSTTGRRLTSVSWPGLAAGTGDIGSVSAVAFDAKGTSLLIGTTTGAVYAWTLRNNRVHFVKRVGQQPITAIATAATGRRWVMGDASGVIYISNSDRVDGADFASFISIEKRVSYLELDSSGQLLLACVEEVGISANAVDLSRMVSHVDHSLPCAALANEGKDVYASDHSGHLRRWSIAQNSSTLPSLTLNPPNDWNIGDPSGPMQLFSNLHGTLFGHLWVVRLPAEVSTEAQGNRPYNLPKEGVLESADGTFILKYSSKAGLVLATLNKPEQRVQAPRDAPVTACAIGKESPDVAVGYADGRVTSLHDGHEYNSIQISQFPIVSLAVDSASQTIAIADSEGSVVLWRPTDLERSIQPIVVVKEIAEIKFSIGSNQLLLVYCLSGLKFVDLGKREISGALFVTPDLEWVAITEGGFFDGTFGFWDSVRIGNASRADPQPLSAFARDFYHPYLLKLLMQGDKLQGRLDLRNVDRQSPTVRIQANYVHNPYGADQTGWIVVKLDAEEAHPGGGLRDLRLFRNGILLRAWRGDLPLANGHFSAETSLVAGSGPQRLTTYCFNEQDVKGKDAGVEILVPPTARSVRTLHILAIGISKYESPLLSLNYADADAVAFGDALARSFDQLGTFDYIKIYPLTNEEASRKNVLLSLRRLSGGSRPLIDSPLISVLHEMQVPGPEDVVVVYYSGHAGVVDKEFRLFPYDAHFYIENGVISVDALKATSISESELSRALERIDGSRFILVVDACQSGQLLMSSDPRLGPINAKGFAQLAFEKGMATIVAARPQQMALEDNALQHGLLTYALISTLSDTAPSQRPDKRRLTLGEWFDDASRSVPELYRELSGVRGRTKYSEKPVEDLESQHPIVVVGTEDNRNFVIHLGHGGGRPN